MSQDPTNIPLPDPAAARASAQAVPAPSTRTPAAYPSGTEHPIALTHSSEIILCTFNARYIHAALGLRYLLANMGALAPHTEMLEMTTQINADQALERLLDRQPRIIGFGVYIWNVEKTLEIVQLLKVLRPDITVVLGGPEVSYEVDQQPLCELADHVIAGAADISFSTLCSDILTGTAAPKQIASLPVKLAALALPYRYLSDRDLRERIIYIEASRGCPFKCEFCLSSLDRTAYEFPQPQLLAELARLHERGARQFKFVDRTFNLKIATCIDILDFFLKRLDDQLALHFELIPDRLPDRLREKISQFPDGVLQFEIGIQSFNAEVQNLISRRQDMKKTRDNIRWLRRESGAHIHADLIAGLPGEDIDSFGAGFDALVGLGPQEIQVGLLKRLRGTPIDRHTAPFGMRYQPVAPYRVLATNVISFSDMQRLARFSRYWDMVANSGRFSSSLPYILADQPFTEFMALSDYLYAQTGQTHAIALARLFKLVFTAVRQRDLGRTERNATFAMVNKASTHNAPLKVTLVAFTTALIQDYERSGLQIPQWLQEYKATTAATTAADSIKPPVPVPENSIGNAASTARPQVSSAADGKDHDIHPKRRRLRQQTHPQQR